MNRYVAYRHDEWGDDIYLRGNGKTTWHLSKAKKYNINSTVGVVRVFFHILFRYGLLMKLKKV